MEQIMGQILDTFTAQTRADAIPLVISGAAREGIKANDMVFPQPKSLFVDVFEKLANARDLEYDEAFESFKAMCTGRMSPACIGTFLMGLKTKGETPLELLCAVRALLEEAVPVPEIAAPHIDVVGTGGDRTHSFNCSTATCLTLAAMGYKVTKHGNRSVSSISGSADVLEAVGVPLDLPAPRLMEELERSNFVFLFAPLYHPAFKRIAPVRKEIGAHTIFNVIGPLLNPTRPTHQLLGVPGGRYVSLLGETMAMLGVKRGAVVFGAGGFDEVSPCGKTQVMWVRDGWTKPGILDPESVGMKLHDPREVSVRDPDEAVDVFLEALRGSGRPAVRDMLVLNTALALTLLEDGLTFPAAVERAKEGVESGVAGKKFFGKGRAYALYA
ncbi:MAG: anthranilate phosphoribosyltransferase [Synergistaceae bacterium]|jgi:anthranilate phosphoribosyltransferase|nr:anthranilate phosphoribosyltransferase [Synergistaceae bacterium]